MLTLLIGGIAVILLIVTASNGEWGPFALTIVITLVLIAMASGDRKDSRAYMNFRDYWAEGGPDRERRRRR